MNLLVILYLLLSVVRILMPEAVEPTNYSAEFAKLGYVINETKKPWRHVLIDASKREQRVMIKVATDSELADKVTNQIAWQQYLQQFNLPISVPKVLEVGELNGLPWFSCEFVEGQQLAKPHVGTDTKLLESRLHDVGSYLIAIHNLAKPFLLPKDWQKLAATQYANVMNNARKRLGDVELVDNELIEFVGQMKNLESCYQHNDFTPWHIIATEDNKMYLIDGEHSGILSLKWFDAAHLYHRLFTNIERKDIANRFLGLIMSNMNDADKQQFITLVASRVCGGYWEALKHGWVKRETQDELRNLIISGNFWNQA